MGLFDFWKKKKTEEGKGPKGEEVSPGGSTIYRYETPADEGFRPPAATGVYMKEIEAHFEKAFPGHGSFVFHELISDLVHIDVHIMTPTPKANYQILYTTGMSDLPMHLPEEIGHREDLKYAELYMLLPGDWKTGEGLPPGETLPPEYFWPIGLLKFLARFPHEYRTWLGWGHTIPNGPDYAPLAEGVGFGGAVLSHLSIVPDLKTEDGKEINFYLVIPAYREEIEYKLKFGMEGLDQRYSEKELPVVLDVHRPNFCADFQERLD